MWNAKMTRLKNILANTVEKIAWLSIRVDIISVVWFGLFKVRLVIVALKQTQVVITAKGQREFNGQFTQICLATWGLHHEFNGVNTCIRCMRLFMNHTSEWMARCDDKVLLSVLTADGNSAAAAPTWMASYGCPGSYPFRPSPARNHGQQCCLLAIRRS